MMEATSEQIVEFYDEFKNGYDKSVFNTNLLKLSQ